MTHFLMHFYPQQTLCHLCQHALWFGDGFLCAHCKKNLADCLLPFSLQMQTHPDMPITSLAPYAMDDTAKALIHRLKFRHDRACAYPLAEQMALVAKMQLHRAGLNPSVIVAVPSCKAHQRMRGYNQAELLALIVAFHLGLPYQPNALKRIQKHHSQVGKTKMARMLEMSKAFAHGDGLHVQNQVVLLVDDVITTGATIKACSNVLLEAGALQVVALTACRR